MRQGSFLRSFMPSMTLSTSIFAIGKHPVNFQVSRSKKGFAPKSFKPVLNWLKVRYAPVEVTKCRHLCFAVPADIRLWRYGPGKYSLWCSKQFFYVQNDCHFLVAIFCITKTTIPVAGRLLF